MTVSVTLLYNDDDFETREFDTLPRIGDTIVFMAAVDFRRRHVHGTARALVTKVAHEMTIGNHRPVHAYVAIEPESTADATLLDALLDAAAEPLPEDAR